MEPRLQSTILLLLSIALNYYIYPIQSQGVGNVTFPNWSWDKLQHMTFFQGCNETGTDVAFNETMLDVLTRYNLVCIEKGQGQNSSIPGWYAEDYMLAAAKQIKSVNPDIHMCYYLNSVDDWTMYELHQQFMNHSDWWLRNATGAVIRSNGDHHFKNSTGLLNFDMSNDECSKWWASSCLNMTDTEYFESCNIDKVYVWSDSYKDNNTLSNKTDATFNPYKYDILVSMQEHMNLTGNGPLYINNGFHFPGVNGYCLEGFQPIEEDIMDLCNRSDGEQLAIKVHGGYNLAEGCSGQSFIDVLAAYLIGVQKYQYFSCNQIWIGGDGNWHDEYYKALGEPKQKFPVKMNNTYYRSFASGTSVTFDTINNTGRIYWADDNERGFLDNLEYLYLKEWKSYHKNWRFDTML